MSPDKLVDGPFHVGCQDKTGPGKIHEVILVIDKVILFTIDIKSPVSKSMKLCTEEVVNQTASGLVCYVRNLNCVVPENIYTPSPTEGTFALDPPPGKNSYVKNAVALYYYSKDNCFCDKELEKNPFIHVNTVSNNLNFAL